ncbi:cytochrome c oxidase subunit II [Sphingomonas changbaiensis NBRC 104936]|uniref:cytochrome-c oxidase n=1 Tax=Sphingomonas changbaiensis NBRC 104936 TaxID=1219043 RepID=A0A0E9MLS0_9SPHN|nr:cytochrome c oxidase subunit II [Sphingomonas changbaiensis]GAO38747.1 cytochrome c oxidase subunit II [Sphingomonas changbaiensis NBRC 104936]
MIVAIVIAALVLGSLLFHWLSPWWMTPLASNWGSIDTALIITMWICAVAFVALNLFMALTIWRYRHRPGSRAHYEPENSRLEKRLTLWTALGIAGMLAPGLLAWNQYVTVPADAAVVEANGEQWRWSFRLPGRDGVLGTAEPARITADNAFGLNPDDPYGRDDLIVDTAELHLPVNRPVKMVLRSKDVLHDFYVPEFRAKMDLVPGIVTYFWLTPTQKGSFDILCAELCGTGHSQMRGTVVVEDEASYRKWLGDQMTFGQMMAQAGEGRTRLARADANPSKRVAR